MCKVDGVKVIGRSEFCVHVAVIPEAFSLIISPPSIHPGYMNPGGPPPVQGFGVQAAGPEIDPGSLGQMDSGAASQTYGNDDGYGQAGFEDEPPLLQELGIDFELIKQKVCNYRVILVKFSSIYLLFSIPISPFCTHLYNVTYMYTSITLW